MLITRHFSNKFALIQCGIVCFVYKFVINITMGDNVNNVPILNIPSNERILKLSDKFYKDFGCKPCYYVRVPGRVNIIGEHIDYCGYPVLPMALEQDILMAANIIDDPKLYLRNADYKYKSVDIKINTQEELDIVPDLNGKPYWYNYILCGIKGAMEHLKSTEWKGLQLYVDGNIPPASGLSSSSALVSAACLAFLYAQNGTLDKTEIASLCAKSERYIGTQGGGMDQAIAFLAKKYSAQYITFQPLNAAPVALPEDAAFVVAHSLAEANKAATNDFNRRVIECRLAAKIIAKLSGLPCEGKILTLSQLQRNLNKKLEEMIELVQKYIPQDIYTKNEICDILNMKEAEIDEIFLTSNTKHLTEFKLKQRALHVYQEAQRVEEFRKICSQSELRHDTMNGATNGSGNGHLNSNNSDLLLALGKLMSESHESLKTLYECSHQNLDHLVNISQKFDINSRLTGAGWGGCIVALCPKEKVEQYIELLKEEFYVKYCKLDKKSAESYVFATTPNHGALIYRNL
ncbi:N-acetylgalactosamine kinase [Papilio machaon]|uniref:N-acetylgalactosamine kinase n=1 Tax=Papilio machaon TaxID=76193 RepID=UPI001E66502D|nr:N-acetylgalactosamine kinase [Papilio machaon]